MVNAAFTRRWLKWRLDSVREIGRVFSWLRLDTSNGDLVRAQLEAYSKLVPVLYIILMVNAASVSVTHSGLAPDLLSVFVPIILVCLCLARLIAWVRMQDGPRDTAAAIAALKAATVAGGVMGVLFLAWVAALYAYGTTETRGHLSVVIGITGVAAIFGMMHVRPAAILVAILLALPYSAFLATQGVTAAMIGLNITLAIVGVLYILKLVSLDFRRMVLSQVETKRLSDENLRLANRDNLTDLPNRRRFFSELDIWLAQSTKDDVPLAVGVIDLDGFKPVNDTYGHVAGDHVLREVGRRLASFAQDGRLIARLGGDEFGVICAGVRDDDELLELGNSICAALREPFVLDDLVVCIGASTGFAAGYGAGDSSMQFYERADYTLYHAKLTERGGTVLFDLSHETAISRNLRIEQAFRAADLETEMTLQFQPMMDVVAGRTAGFEALARWNSPFIGSIPPGEFIPVAERTERIHVITHCLLRKALKAAATWDDRLIVSFNLSVRDLLSPKSMLQIVSIVEQSGVRPGRIDFEVTETALMSDFVQAQAAIRLLKALGSRVSLDDFGTGYSSLSHVHRLPFDKIKIDRSFISDIENAGASQTIVRSVVDLCRSLEIDCIVEGMETQEQADTLKRLGCNAMQGYYFSKPLDASEIGRFIGGADQAALLRGART